ncbi:30S ribosomal protein S6 [Chloroflexota bacterium]
MTTRKKEVVQVEDKRIHDYELVFVISPEIVDESLEAAVDGVSKFITGKGGDVSEIERWGKKRLAYPLKRFSEGNYVLIRFKMNPEWSKELETSLKISEDILRHLLINLSE